MNAIKACLFVFSAANPNLIWSSMNNNQVYLRTPSSPTNLLSTHTKHMFAQIRYLANDHDVQFAFQLICYPKSIWLKDDLLRRRHLRYVLQTQCLWIYQY